MTPFLLLIKSLWTEPTHVSRVPAPSATAHNWRCHAAVLNLGTDLRSGLWEYELKASFNSKTANAGSHHSMDCQSTAALQQFQLLETDEAPIFERNSCSKPLAKKAGFWRYQFSANAKSSRQLETRAPGKMEALQDASSTGAHQEAEKAHSRGGLVAAFQSASILPSPLEREWQALRSRSTSHRHRGVDPSVWDLLDHNAVLYGLIVANFGVWVLWQSPKRRQFMEKHFLVSVASIQDRRDHTAVTANFSHSDAGHLTLNMLALHSFGRMIGNSRLFGGGGLLALYLAGGLGCVAGHCLYWSYFVPWKQGINRRAYNPRRTPSILGASGSVSALLTCSILFNPSQTLLVYGFPVPAWLYGIGVTALDLSGAIGVSHESRIGYAGHLGGAAVGIAAWLFFRRSR